MRSGRLLWGAFLFFLVLDLVLLSLYLKAPKETQDQTPGKKEARLETLTPTSGLTMKILPGDPTKGSLKEVEVEGIITKEPFFEKGEASIFVSFPQKGGGKIVAQVVLGQKEEMILTLFAKGLQIGARQEWRARTVGELLSYLKAGEPIKVRFSLQKPPQTWFDDPRCDISCQRRLRKVSNFFPTNSEFFEALNSGQPVKGSFKIGAVSALVISK